MLCALIMAGGRGERFWPLSTNEKPKQFLSLIGERTMIQMTVDRIKELIPLDRIFIVTGEIYKNLVVEQLPEIPERNIIVEPCGRNTAPCITLSALYIKNIYKDAVMAVLPSDHLIKNESRFREVLSVADTFVENNEKAVVTIGLSPDRPETAYGYIKYKKVNEGKASNEEAAVDVENMEVLTVDSFVEKPNLDRAKEYLNSGNYLWNGGMFIWSVDNVLRLSELHINSTYEMLKSIDMSNIESFNKECKEKYPLVENISVDYAIMEKAEDIHVIPGDFGWDDVGSWNAVERYSSKDESSNVKKGNVKSINSKNNMFISAGKPIIAAGVEDLLVVECDDCIFVCSKEEINRLRDIKNSVM